MHQKHLLLGQLSTAELVPRYCRYSPVEEEEPLTDEGELRLILTQVLRRFQEVDSRGRAGFKPGIAANFTANFHVNPN